MYVIGMAQLQLMSHVRLFDVQCAALGNTVGGAPV